MIAVFGKLHLNCQQSFQMLAGYVEMDIPYKVGRALSSVLRHDSVSAAETLGSVGRAPLQTSPLHRRFAWQWWFLGLGSLARHSMGFVASFPESADACGEGGCS